ncbi:MAG TPA: glycine zipper 2TM domain-containing protein [Tepidisphaeraceae bacterium]|nr:glycine zipper 2TM domain-containing protein [Tepidisphaeraceae bacterium]
MWKRTTSWLLVGSIGLVGPLAGCESLPGNSKEQGAVIGGAGGAAAGAAIAKDNRLAGALIGGILGAGGGYLVGTKVDKDKKKGDGEMRQEAQTAADRAKADPASAEEAKVSTTADVNEDGFVTLDEVVAMEEAGLSNPEMIKRLRRTQQYFQLTADQEKYLRDRGVDNKVIEAMRDMRPTSTDDSRVASDTTREEQKKTDVDMRTDRDR